MRRILRTVLPLALLAVALWACSREARVIPVRKMEKIYREMFLADQWLNGNPQKRPMADTTWFYAPIFEKYGYTVEDYRKSVDSYLNDPERYAEMLKRVCSSLSKESSSLTAKVDREDRFKRQADSVARAMKSKELKVFPLYSELFGEDVRTDTVVFALDSLGVYSPSAVLYGTVINGPAVEPRAASESQEAAADTLRKLDLKLQPGTAPVRADAGVLELRELK